MKMALPGDREEGLKFRRLKELLVFFRNFASITGIQSKF